MSRLVGINHVALEVADLDAALAVLGGMGLEGLEKTPEALEELRRKDLGG